MEKVKKLRQELGISQKELIHKLGVRQSHYSSLENGVYKPNNKERIKEQAIEILYPILMKKLLSAREEVERLENMSLQFNPKN